MKRTLLYLASVITIAGGGLANAAMISLDTAGADPDLTSPTFSFQTGPDGTFFGTYTNRSNPPVDFTSLTLTAQFTPDFYFMAGGPLRGGSSCDGGDYFARCSVSFENDITTLVFSFFGIDDTHPGLPYLTQFPVSANAFQSNQIVGATATVVTAAATPEPGAFGLAAAGLILGAFLVRRKELYKIGIRT